MKSRCERPSLPSQAPPETGDGAFVLLPVPHPLVPVSPADPVGDLLAKWGHWAGWKGAGGEPISWGTPWGWARLLQRASGHRRARHSTPSPASRPLDIKGTFPCAKGIPNPSYPIPFSPAPSPSTLGLTPPARLGTYPILPLMSPAILCTGTHAFPEIFPLIALAQRG